MKGHKHSPGPTAAPAKEVVGKELNCSPHVMDWKARGVEAMLQPE